MKLRFNPFSDHCCAGEHRHISTPGKDKRIRFASEFTTLQALFSELNEGDVVYIDDAIKFDGESPIASPDGITLYDAGGKIYTVDDVTIFSTGIDDLKGYGVHFQGSDSVVKTSNLLHTGGNNHEYYGCKFEKFYRLFNSGAASDLKIVGGIISGNKDMVARQTPIRTIFLGVHIDCNGVIGIWGAFPLFMFDNWLYNGNPAIITCGGKIHGNWIEDSDTAIKVSGTLTPLSIKDIDVYIASGLTKTNGIQMTALSVGSDRYVVIDAVDFLGRGTLTNGITCDDVDMTDHIRKIHGCDMGLATNPFKFYNQTQKDSILVFADNYGDISYFN